MENKYQRQKEIIDAVFFWGTISFLLINLIIWGLSYFYEYLSEKKKTFTVVDVVQLDI